MLNLAAYHFVAIEQPADLAAQLRARCEALGLLGTLLVTPEGINCFLAGTEHTIQDFVDALRSDARFSAMPIKLSRSEHIPFKRLRVKVKKEIITFRQDGVAPVPGSGVTRAPAVAPATLARWLAQGHDDVGREVVMLDTRNAEEIEHGSFDHALTLPIGKFTDLPEALEPHRDSLRGKTVVGFCTGGIRCEKAAPWMINAGYENVMHLDGGILGYFEHIGGAHWHGECFVFDERIALKPDLSPSRDVPVSIDDGPQALNQALHGLTNQNQ